MSIKDKPVGFAIIGCGMMGQRHVEILRATPGAGVVCVFDRSQENARKFAGDAKVAATYEEVLRQPGVDAVVIGLPSGLHAEFGIKAAQAGKHVVTEKPIDIEPSAGQRLAAACEEAGVVCAVISQNRFADGTAALKAALDRGDLGKPVLARASVKWFRHDQYYTGSDWRGTIRGEGGGVLMNQAIHNMDLMCWLLGPPVSVKGLIRSNREVMETEDVGIAAMEFPNGVLATFEASTSTFPGFEERIEVHSQIASCIVEKGQIVYWKHAEDKPQPIPPSFEPPTPGLSAKYELFQRQYRNILAAIAGTEPLAVTPQQAIDVLVATKAIY
ncbi:MAG: Gfo/Idh/MocA family oxidoreductase [Candidatus Sumerlaeaceae bacterium]|nr:Gfo/Idh/MocA family oxidoreductase [Candidatus Sumerlaeaceae bacterium]